MAFAVHGSPPDHYVFPSERYGFDGNAGRLHGAVKVYDLDPTKPMASMKVACMTFAAKRRGFGVGSMILGTLSFRLWVKREFRGRL